MRRGLVLVLVSCGSSEGPVPMPVDAPAAPDAVARDAPVGDGGAPLLWVDFAAAGCETFDPSVPVCRGTAALTLHFVAVTPAPADTFLWTFGDGSESSTDRSPVHGFALPGLYTVTLAVGGPGGTAQRMRDDYVRVDAAPLAARCDRPGQCESGLECELGFCTRGCAQTPCDPGAVCADLGPNGGAETWRRPLCLLACQTDAQCSGGLRCRELRDENGWVKGCFTEALRDEGESCAAPDGTLDDGMCASGSCAELGARGLCAMGCGGHPCPSYAACADMNYGASLCLARCGTCDKDPWLGCEMPGASGYLGFVAPSGSYCAPRRCTGGDCGPDGVCDQGYCRANR